MMRFSTLLLFSVLFAFSAEANSLNSGDSLELTLAGHLKRDSARVNLLSKLSYYYRFNQPSKALNFASEGLSISKEINYAYGKVYSLNNLGTIYKNKGQYQRALNYYLQAQQMISIKDSLVIRGVALAINNIGLIYEGRGNYELAQDYLTRALQIDVSLNYPRGIARELGNLGTVALDLNKVDSALFYFQKSLSIDSVIGNVNGVTESLTDIGRALTVKKEYEAAKNSFQRAFALNDPGNIAAYAYAHHYLGITYREMELNDSALSQQLKAYQLATSLDEKSLIRDASRELSVLYREKENYKRSLEYLDTYNYLSSYLTDQKAASMLADLRENYESQKKQQQIEGLEKIKVKMEYYNNRLVKFRNGLFLSLSVSLLLASIIYKAYRDKRRVNVELMRKFAEGRQLNEDLKLKSIEIETKNIAILEKNKILESQSHQLVEAQRIARLGSWEYDPESKLFFWSDLLFELFGLEKNKKIPGVHSFIQRVYTDDRKLVVDAIKYLFKEKKSVNINFRLHGNFDEVRFIQAKAVPVFDEHHRIKLFSGTVLDTTEQKLNERRLIEAKEQAELANRSKSIFLANMSHEIRTPLNGILGFTDILLKENCNSQQIEFLRHIRNSGDTLLLLLNDILDFNKIEHGKLVVENVNYELRESVNQALMPYAIQAKAKGLDFVVEVSPEVPQWIVGDSHRTKQLLVNYVSNALKFTGRGRIKVSVNVKEIQVPEGNSLELMFTVADSGLGVPAEKQDVIFELFTQADDSTTRKFGGTGLGLAITRQLSKLMGGNTGLTSPGSLGLSKETPGSDFWFTIKVNRGYPPPEKKVASDKAQIRFVNPISVLVAEDNPINQMLMRKVLDGMNCKITMVENGKLAVEALENEMFDVVLLDIQMPVMDGHQAALMMRQSKNSNIPIIGVSANVFKEDIEKSLSAGMDAHIGKPFTASELFVTISRFVFDNETKQNQQDFKS
jgi:signal transduction histidine kinase